ncbi:MAG: exo-alpha-sialidase, partial [Gemmatimonadetes bacterium]|nr:exo-alpha-sialidase [Gemmatimonadota bacterium]
TVGALTSPAGPASGESYLAWDGAKLWMTWTEAREAVHHVLIAHHDGASWSEPTSLAVGTDFFVNWADFPALLVKGDTLVSHWLQRGGQGTYDYGVRLSWSTDGGDTWSEPWTPHEDDTPTEHGFVSYFDGPQGISAVWLDGRNMVAGEGHGGPGAMTVRTRVLPIGRMAGPEVVLDAMTCECCQTDATVAGGVPVVAYRDRSEAEVRNIHIARYQDGQWTEGRPVHDDGWVIGGCPVNGPALASEGPRVGVAWFTAPDEEAQVRVAFSEDRGTTFGDPVRVDEGSPSGRVDLLSLGEAGMLVTWLERRDGGAAVLSRIVAPKGELGKVMTLAATSEGRASGFPRIARYGSDRLAVAWTDPDGEGQVHVADYALSDWEGRP